MSQYDRDAPTYVSMPKHIWDRMNREGDISGHVEFTNSLRLAQADAAAMARMHPANVAVVVRVETDRLFTDHGEPAVFLQSAERHRHEHEYSFSFLKHRIERFINYVVHVIEVGIDHIEDDIEELSGVYN